LISWTVGFASMASQIFLCGSIWPTILR
jgi:hypothetical protein